MSDLGWFSDTNNWVTAHKELLTLAGTVLFVPLVTGIVTRTLSRSSERRAAKQWEQEFRIQKMAKIADYRRNWIRGLRNEVAEFIAQSSRLLGQDSEAARTEMLRAKAKILIRVNTNEPEYPQLTALLDSCLDPTSQKKLEAHQEELTDVAKVIIKRAWNTLKEQMQIFEERFEDGS